MTHFWIKKGKVGLGFRVKVRVRVKVKVRVRVRVRGGVKAGVGVRRLML